MTAAAFTGTLADMRFVRSRSVMQIVIEVPIERAETVIATLGVPQPGAERPVAVALLNSGASPATPRESLATPEPASGKAERQPDAPLSSGARAVKMAGILCADERFQRWLWEQSGSASIPNDDWTYYDWEKWTADFVRAKCGIVSRRELATNEMARARWHALETAFRQATGQLAEDRS